MTNILDIATNLSALTIILIAAAIVLLLAAWWIVRRRRLRIYDEELPPLVFTVHDRISAPPGMRPGVFHGPPPNAPWQVESPTPSAPGRASPPPAPQAPPPPPPSHQATPAAAPPMPHTDARARHTSHGADVRHASDGNGIGQRRASDEVTVRVPRYQEQPRAQFLPGRLEVQVAGEAGPRAGEDIRFPITRNPDCIVILGRDDGPLGAHVKLPVESVSRRHARMQFENGRWKITNLSRTNPTLVNGEELMVAEGARWLYEGDTIEMGELVFRFHEQ